MYSVKWDCRAWRYREWSTGRQDCYISSAQLGSFIDIRLGQSSHYKMLAEWCVNEWKSNGISTRLIHLILKRKQEKLYFFRSFANRRSRPGQIFQSILIGFYFACGRGFDCDFDLSGIFINATIADCCITEFIDFRVYVSCGNSPGHSLATWRTAIAIIATQREEKQLRFSDSTLLGKDAQ